MNKMQDILSLFYKSEGIPLYLYAGKTCISSFPEDNSVPQPPQGIRESLYRLLPPDNSEIVYAFSDSNCAFFLLPLSDTEWIIGGPCCISRPTAPVLITMAKEYAIPQSQRNSFFEAICRIPPLLGLTLAWKASLLQYCLTGKLSPAVTKDQFGSMAPPPSHQFLTEQTAQLYSTQTLAAGNNSYELESQLLRFVREGDVEGYRNFLANVPACYPGKVADDILREFKTYGIMIITLVSRAAMETGLPRETAYSISDTYMVHLERLTKMEDVSVFISQALMDYICRIRDLKTQISAEHPGYTPLLRKCVNYIHRNLNQRTTTADIANHVGLSRSYLSVLFKESIGIPPAQYIRNARLDEACSLLAYSDVSLVEISNSLCFSSQSHFQKAFRQRFGQTPQAYRRAHRP